MIIQDREYYYGSSKDGELRVCRWHEGFKAWCFLKDGEVMGMPEDWFNPQEVVTWGVPEIPLDN